MKLENQVCTLEQAKRLKELGVTQETYFSWCGDEEVRLLDCGVKGAKIGAWVYVDTTRPANNTEADHREDVPSAKPFAAALNVAELMLALPSDCHIWKDGEDMRWNAVSITYNTSCKNFNIAIPIADLLIHHLEVGIVTADEVNERLSS